MPGFIEIQDLSFGYPVPGREQITAIKNISLSVSEGEFIAVIGQNGSGKSTLGKLLNALLIPDEGNVFISGMNTRERTNHPKIRTKVGMVFQRPQDQIVATTVGEDVAFGPGNLGLPPREIRVRVEEALSSVGLASFMHRASYLLSAGETQRLALAGVLAMQPKCVIFDETTAMLDPLGREMVMRQARELHQSGMTILFITHLMEEAAQAERIMVLHNGKLVLDGIPEKVFSNRKFLIEIGLDLPPLAVLGNALRKYFPGISINCLSESHLLKSIPAYTGKPTNRLPLKKKIDDSAQVIFVENLGHVYLQDTPLAHPSLKKANLKVKTGNVHGLIGPTGSGKSTLLQHLNGLIYPQSGKVSVLGRDLSDKELEMIALRKTIGLAFQQPEDQVFEQYVGDEVAFAPRNFRIPGKISEIVRAAMQAVGLEFETYKDRFISTLSGGERRKVALASVLAGQPEILLLDEPFAGLDPQSRRELSNHLLDLKKQGITMLISTHQFEGVVEMMDQLSILAVGRDILHGVPGAVFIKSETLDKIGIKPPLTIRIAEKLREKGWPIPQGVFSPEAINQSLAEISGEAVK